MARAEAGRRRSALPAPVVAELDDLCVQAADDAVVAVIRKLDDFAGRSRFTTWAIKFVIFEVSTRLRRHAWRHRTEPFDDDAWARLPDPTAATDARHTEHVETLVVLRRAVERDLSPRQRDVFVSAAIRATPIDVLAERLGTTRGAVYKVLHDARRKLRTALADAGLEVHP